MRLRAVAALALLALPASAHATAGLQWTFHGPRQFILHADLQLPELLHLTAQRNHEVKVSEIDFAVVTTCTPDETLGKRGWELMCKLDDLAMKAAPARGKDDLVLPVLDDWDQVLTGASVQLVFTRDGRVRDFDLEQPKLVDQNARTRQMVEDMRQLVNRVFSAFDLELPKKGDDKGHGSWTQRQSPVLGFPTGQGTLGSATVEHRITGTEGRVVDITTTARGILGSGDMIAVGGQERPANLFDMTLKGTARFDTEHGVLVARDYQTRGTLTASSIDSTGQKGYPWVQIVKLRWVPPDTAPPAFGKNQVMQRLQEDTPPSTGRAMNPPPQP